jgi:hypothetical protein
LRSKILSICLSQIELAQLRNESLFSLANLTVPVGGTRALTANGATMDLELTVALPPVMTHHLEFSLDVLAAAAMASGQGSSGTGGNATTVTVSISPPTLMDNNSAADDVAHGAGGGTRHGILRITAPRITNTSWDPWGALESNFTLLSSENTLELRVVVDRSIVEVWAAGGRAVISVRDFPDVGETAVRLRHQHSGTIAATGESASPPLRVERLEGWGMGCGWL